MYIAMSTRSITVADGEADTTQTGGTFIAATLRGKERQEKPRLKSETHG